MSENFHDHGMRGMRSNSNGHDKRPSMTHAARGYRAVYRHR